MNKEQNQRLPQKPTFRKVLQNSTLSFLAMNPLLLGIIGLVGLFQVLVTPKMLAALFRVNGVIDTLIGH